MHETSYSKMQAFVEHYLVKANSSRLEVIDVGSQSVEGHLTYRPLFNRPTWRYRGLDSSAGVNVDIPVRDPYQWHEVEDASVDVVISGQALEHIDYPWLTFSEIARILRPGGVACLIAPASGPEHRYPHDCWRFYPDGMQALAESANLRPVEVFTDWGILPWQDTFLVLQKPMAASSADAPFPQLEDSGAALSVYKRALDSRPKHPHYYITLVGLLEKSGQLSAVEMALRIGMEACPGAAELRCKLVHHLMTTSRHDAAFEHAVALLGTRPILPANVEAMGRLFAASDVPQQQVFASLLPSDPQALARLAWLSTASDFHPLAASCWYKLHQLEPHSIGHVIQRAGSLLGSGNYDQAREAYSCALKIQLERSEINRTTVVQRLIAARKAKVYLEIGVECGNNFFQIDAPIKLAVDPKFRIPGGERGHDNELFFRMTSDAFFASPPKEIVESGIDVALVDGLHTHAQSLRDIENCLRYLNPNGIIVVHDCLPASEAEAEPSEEAARRKRQSKSGDWTGDVYRSIVSLRAERSDLFVAVIDTDHGVGLVERGRAESTIALSPPQIETLDFQTLSADRSVLLNLKPIRWFDRWLNNWHSQGDCQTKIQ